MAKNTIKFDVPLFECGKVIVCFSGKAFAKRFRKYNGGEFDEALLQSAGLFRHFHNAETGDNVYLIGVFNNQYGTLAHEASHAAFAILDTVGVDVSADEPNETFCYLLGYIVREAGRIGSDGGQ